MYYHKYNTSSAFSINKEMNNYLRFYQENLLRNILKKQTPKVDTCMTSFNPIDPNIYILLFPLTNILAFLAGYYSHYFLKK